MSPLAIALVVVLAVTNLVTLAVLLLRAVTPDDPPAPDPSTAAALDRSPRPPAAMRGPRRLITIEILNPIELAGTRGRLAWLAGTLAPGITRRVVYDQTLKILKQQLETEQVVADVRVHTLQPVPADQPAPTGSPTEYADEVRHVDLEVVDEAPPAPDRSAGPDNGRRTTEPPPAGGTDSPGAGGTLEA